MNSMMGINRAANIILNFIAFVCFIFGLQSTVNSIALYACFATPPLSFWSVLLLAAPAFKFLFIRLRTKPERGTPRGILDLNLTGRLLHKEEKDGS